MPNNITNIHMHPNFFCDTPYSDRLTTDYASAQVDYFQDFPTFPPQNMVYYNLDIHALSLNGHKVVFQIYVSLGGIYP